MPLNRLVDGKLPNGLAPLSIMKKVGCTIQNLVGFIHQMPTQKVYGYGKKNWDGYGPRKVSGPTSTRMILRVGSITRPTETANRSFTII